MFELESTYKPTGDQPEAIKALVDGVRAGAPAQTLLGVTGSGKTFTIANVIAQLNRPTLILSHNKTLAAQLYSEMKAFFPKNAVEGFLSVCDADAGHGHDLAQDALCALDQRDYARIFAELDPA